MLVIQLLFEFRSITGRAAVEAVVHPHCKTNGFAGTPARSNLASVLRAMSIYFLSLFQLITLIA